MKLMFDDHDHLSVVAMRGEMHDEDVDAFRSNVLKRMDRHIRDFVLDMSELDKIDSKGLEVLLWLVEQVADQLGQVALVNLSDELKAILAITRLTAKFNCYEDIESAMNGLR